MSVAGIVLAAIAVFVWTAALVSMVVVRRALRFLRDAPDTVEGAWPRVSVIIPALNEADTIEAALVSKLGVDYPELELVVVDDRSTDETGAIVDRIAARDPRVRAVHITSLPDGWLGKVHALHVGAQHATGELLLFSDADVHFAPSTIKRAVRALRDGGFQFLAVMPQFLSVGLVVDAMVVAFARTVAVGLRIWAAEDPKKAHAVGVGAFGLVERAALERTEGFTWLRCEVADDVALALLLKRSGARCGVCDGHGLVSLTFYPSVTAMIRAVEKQGFSILGRYSVLRTVLISTLPVSLEWVGLFLFVPELSPWVRGLVVAATALQIAVGLSAARIAGLGVGAALLAPLGMTLIALAMVRSAVMAVVHGGVRWRGTVYPTAVLREGQRVRFP